MIYGEGKYRYELIEGWGQGPEGFEMGVVLGVVTDSDDRVYVCQSDSRPIDLGYSTERCYPPGVAVFDREGRFLSFWGNQACADSKESKGWRGFAGPHGIWISADQRVFIADSLDHTVRIFTTEGSLLQTLGNPCKPSDSGYDGESLESIERGAPPFNRPTGSMAGPSGCIYVSDGYGNARVHKFSPEGELLLSWGEPGTGHGQFNLPHQLWVDQQERIYVVDRMNHRIQIFDSRGNFLTQWTHVTRPQQLFIDPEGTVFVLETAQSILIMTAEGEVLERWGEKGTGPGQFCHNTHTVCRDSQGALYMGVGRAINNLQKFARV